MLRFFYQLAVSDVSKCTSAFVFLDCTIIGSPETSEIAHPAAQLHVWEDPSPQQPWRKSLHCSADCRVYALYQLVYLSVNLEKLRKGQSACKLYDTDGVKTKNMTPGWESTFAFITERIHGAVLLEVKWSLLMKNVCFYWTSTFITVFTTALLLSLMFAHRPNLLPPIVFL